MRVGIVGAGITGLALTHHLAARGIDVVTFEADTEPGGVIRSRRVDGRVVEDGPQRLRLTDGVRTLVAATGLEDELVTPDPDLPLYVYVDDELREVPTSIRSFLRTDALSWPAKARILWEPMTEPIAPQERAATALTRKFGPDAYERLIAPLFGGMYGSDPARMPAAHALDRLMALEAREGSLLRAALGRLRGGRAGPPPASFRGGLQALPAALYDRHSPYVHLDTPVSQVRPAGDGGGDGYALAAAGRSVAVDRVVVTTPASTAASILAPVLGDGADRLAALRYNSLALVHLVAPSSRRGFGYQVARTEGLRTLGVTWNASLFDRDGVHTAFFGGMWDPGILDRDDEALASIAQREFAAVMGETPAVLGVTRLPAVMPAFDESWAGLEDVTCPDGVTLATNYTGHVGIPSRVREAEAIADRLAEQPA